MAESEHAAAPPAAPLSVSRDPAKDPVFLVMIAGQIESAEVRFVSINPLPALLAYTHTHIYIYIYIYIVCVCVQ